MFSGVAGVQQPTQHSNANYDTPYAMVDVNRVASAMTMRVTTKGRLLWLDFADWSILLCGLALIGLLALLA